VQLHVQDVDFHERGPQVLAYWRNREVRVLHFSGGAKRKYPEWQGRFANTPDPLSADRTGDAYSEFLQALRIWIGRYGVQGLAWSFYGLSNAEGAHVRDPSMLPLLATLHYLIRSNGCVRVLETGTARGISAACLASAVAHREGGLVVTLDPHHHPGREELWAILPESFSRCIEAREIDSVEGMQMALQAGETFEAALLDSLHTGEQVWAEFQLAAQLVCPGGLILIHDAVYSGGTVPDALARIQAAGYNVVRLWAATSGAAEDDDLGLAIVENTPRNQATAIATRIMNALSVDG